MRISWNFHFPFVEKRKKGGESNLIIAKESLRNMLH